MESKQKVLGKCAPHCMMLGTELWAFCMLGKHSINGATCPAHRRDAMEERPAMQSVKSTTQADIEVRLKLLEGKSSLR